MALKLTAQRAGFGFFPNSAGYQEEMSVVPERKDIVLTVKMARNPAQLRFFHAMMRRLIQSGAWDENQGSLKEYLLIATGHYKSVILEDGTVFYVVKSISEESMEGIEFKEFIKACKKVIAERLHVDVDELFGGAFLDAGPYDKEGR